VAERATSLHLASCKQRAGEAFSCTNTESTT